MKKLQFFLLIFTIFTIACTKKTNNISTKNDVTDLAIVKPPIANPAPPIAKDPNRVYAVFTIKRTPCYGKCPVYEANLMSDGTAIYSGKKYTEREGEFVSKFVPSELKALITKAREIGFVRMENRYPIDPKNMIADLPYTYTTYNDGQIEKRVANNYDCPPDLIELEQMIDAFIEKLEWSPKESK